MYCFSTLKDLLRHSVTQSLRSLHLFFIFIIHQQKTMKITISYMSNNWPWKSITHFYFTLRRLKLPHQEALILKQWERRINVRQKSQNWPPVIPDSSISFFVCTSISGSCDKGTHTSVVIDFIIKKSIEMFISPRHK